MHLLLSLLLVTLAQAAGLFTKGMDPKIDTKLKEPAAAVVEMKASSDVSAMSSVTQSLQGGKKETMMKMSMEMEGQAKQLPSDDSAVKKKEYKFTAMKNKFDLPTLPNAPKFEMDLGKYLVEQPLVFISRNDKLESVEGLEKPRLKVVELETDKGKSEAMLKLLTQDTFKQFSASGSEGCAAALGGKKVGEKWTHKTVNEKMSVNFDCKFLGWALVDGKKVMVVEVKIPTQKQVVEPKPGEAATVEISGDGKLLVAAENGSKLHRIKMKTSTKMSAAQAEEVRKMTGKPAPTFLADFEAENVSNAM